MCQHISTSGELKSKLLLLSPQFELLAKKLTKLNSNPGLVFASSNGAGMKRHPRQVSATLNTGT